MRLIEKRLKALCILWLSAMPLPSLSLEVDGEKIQLLLPCQRLEEMYEGPMMEEVENTVAVRAKAWRLISTLFKVKHSPPVFKVVKGPLFMVHQNFIAGGAFSSLPMFLRYYSGQYIAEFHRPVVAVNPYVYYFEGMASKWTSPVMLPALIHEFAHVAFLLSGKLDLEFVRRACLDLRFAMQLPFLDDNDIEALRSMSLEVDILMETPALWAEQKVASTLGLNDRVERRLRLQAARDEILRKLMNKHGLCPRGPSAWWRVERLLNHIEKVQGKNVEEVKRYVEAQLEEKLFEVIDKLREGLILRFKDDFVEAPSVMGKTLEWLRLWQYFLEREFSYHHP